MMPKLPSNQLEIGLLAMYLFAPESAGGFVLASAGAQTHGGWTIYRGDLSQAVGRGAGEPIFEVNSKQEAIQYFVKQWKAELCEEDQ